MLNHSTWKC